jgi:hypothetical protein
LSCVGRFFTGVSQLNGDGIVAFIPACSYQKRRSEVAVTARNAGSIGSIRFLHPSVVAEKLLKNVQGSHNRRAVLCEYGQGQRLATPLSAHGFDLFVLLHKPVALQKAAGTEPLQGGTESAPWEVFFVGVIKPTANWRSNSHQ